MSFAYLSETQMSFPVWDEIRQRQYLENLIWYEGEPVGYA
ncbi:hypothetical protein HMPREF9349_01311 [Escherichia coli MS 79-10]|nr:hypothetical protein HMPREF9349_01311 [Escherichia coli MS 79-10]KEJ34579.1 hypothetical protein AB03_5595 [Escherichia coli 2-316-03_S1_C1]